MTYKDHLGRELMDPTDVICDECEGVILESEKRYRGHHTGEIICDTRHDITAVKIVPTTEHKVIEVRVTRDKTGTNWHLYSEQPSEYEAYLATQRALTEGYAHARVVTTVTFSSVSPKKEG